MRYQLTDNYRLQNFMISNQNKSIPVYVRSLFLLAVQRLLCMVHIIIIIIIIVITRLMTHVKVIHTVKNRKCGRSRISEGKLGCKVQSLPIV